MGYAINVRNLHYAVLEKDDKTGVTYDTIKALPGIRSIKISPKFAEGKFYGDGVLVAKNSMLTQIDVEIDITKISLEDRAIILGNSYDKGIIEEKSTDVAPYIALAFEAPHSDGTNKDLVWLYKGQAEPLEDGYEQKEDNIKYQSQTLKLTFIPRVYDEKIRKIADTSDSTFVSTEADSWFNSVPGATV